MRARCSSRLDFSLCRLRRRSPQIAVTRSSPAAASGASRSRTSRSRASRVSPRDIRAARKARPSYEEVSSGTTGHIESVHVMFDPKKVSYARLLDVFWHNVDPLQQNGQFCDHGTQYRSAIFFFDDAQHKAAEASKQAIEQKLGAKTTTLIAPAQAFYDAEDYHQQYYKKNPEHYQAYRAGCVAAMSACTNSGARTQQVTSRGRFARAPRVRSSRARRRRAPLPAYAARACAHAR